MPGRSRQPRGTAGPKTSRLLVGYLGASVGFHGLGCRVSAKVSARSVLDWLRYIYIYTHTHIYINICIHELVFPQPQGNLTPKP